MISTILSFLFLLNPFALFLYFSPIMKSLTHKDFVSILYKASVISFGIFLFIAIAKELLFEHVFNIHFESFKIFGGIIIFSIAYLFIMNGERTFIQLKGGLHEVANQVVLPYMVGAATISLVVVMFDKFNLWRTILLLFVILLINFLIIICLKLFRDLLETKRQEFVFDRFMNIFLRLNGFFLGAIGVNMVLTGFNELNGLI